MTPYLFQIQLPVGTVSVFFPETEWDEPVSTEIKGIPETAIETFKLFHSEYGIGREGHHFDLQNCRPEDLSVMLLTDEVYYKTDQILYWSVLYGDWPERPCCKCPLLCRYRTGKSNPLGVCLITKENRNHNSTCNLFHDQILESANSNKITEDFLLSWIDQAAHGAATSPTNGLPEPSQAQKESGNYKTGKFRISGLQFSIENPAGSLRRGVDPTGKKWSIELKHHYGYVNGSIGKDKDHVDVFFATGITEPDVIDNPIYVVNQLSPSSKKFDEHKVMIGFSSKEKAKAAYLANYEKGWNGLGDVVEMSFADFKGWVLDASATKKPAVK